MTPGRDKPVSSERRRCSQQLFIQTKLLRHGKQLEAIARPGAQGPCISACLKLKNEKLHVISCYACTNKTCMLEEKIKTSFMMNLIL